MHVFSRVSKISLKVSLSSLNTFVILCVFQTSCIPSKFSQQNLKQDSSNGPTVTDSTPPLAPSGLTLVTPASSPSFIQTPLIQIEGVDSGDIIALFSDSGCSIQKATGTATGTSISLTSSSLTSGTYTFYAQSTDSQGNKSACSSANVTYVVDLSTPSVTNISATNPDGIYRANNGTNSILTIEVHLSEVVVVTGTPQLSLNSGRSGAMANYSGGSGTATLTFSYTVQNGDNTNDLDYSSSISLSENGGSILDSAGNSLNTTLPAPATTHSLAANSNLILDTTVPTEPNTFTLQSPGSSPNLLETPTITIGNVNSSDSVFLYSDDCLSLVASGVSTATSINLTTIPLAPGIHSLKARIVDSAGNASNCSTTSISYEVVATSFQVALSSNTVPKGPTDSNFNNFFTITMNRPVTVSTEIQITPASQYADADDFVISATSITFAAGEQQKTVSLTVKGNSGSADFEKDVNVDWVPVGSTLSPVASSFKITDPQALLLTVAPFFPTNGSNWNSYVSGTESLYHISRILTTDLIAASIPDSPCVFTYSTPCLHGGEVKKVVISNRKSCTGLSLTDSAGAFVWKCSASSVPTTFYSVGFQKGKGLKDLISPTGNAWKTLTVSLSENASVVSTSSAATWWTNTVTPLNTANINSGGAAARLTLASANTVYAVTENIASRGINIDEAGIAIVVLPGATLSPTATVASVDCRPAWPSGVQPCFIWNKSKHFVWLEGSIKGASGNYFFVIDRSISGFSFTYNFRGHGLNVDLQGANGIFVNYAGNTVYSDSTFKNGAWGIIDDTVVFNLFHDITIDNMSWGGIDTGWMSAYTKMFNIRVNNSGVSGTQSAIKQSGQYGVLQHFSARNSNIGVTNESSQHVIIDGLAANNNKGFYGTNVDSNSFFHLTASHNGSSGFEHTFGPYQLMFHNILSTNNAKGFLAAGEETIFGLSSIDNTSSEIEIIADSSNIVWNNYLNLGSTTPACVYGTNLTNVGLTNATCDAASSSAFTKTSGINGSSLYAGYKNDTINENGSDGLLGILFSSITDNFFFENQKRNWIFLDTNAWPNSANRGKCASGLCGIYDFTLTTAAPNLKNINGTFAANSACPAITKGSNAIPLYVPALQGTAEYMLDGIGNDDGLCNSDETCYFIPNAGAGLNEPWNYTQTCLYDPDGSATTNVTIYGQQ